jgi:hypothetical protein
MTVDPLVQNLMNSNKDLGIRLNKVETELTEIKTQLRDYLNSEKAARSRMLGSLITIEKLTSGIIQSLEAVTQSFDSPAVSERRRIVEPAIQQLKTLKELQATLEKVVTD